MRCLAKPFLDAVQPESADSYLILPIITRLFTINANKLDKGWDDNAYSDMENVRKTAQSKGHFLEEALILLYEDRYFREKHDDNEKYLAAVTRLNELRDVFDKPDDYFRQIYNFNCQPASKSKAKLTGVFIIYMYHKLDNLADFFASHLDYKMALFCGKFMSKIVAVSPDDINHEQIIEYLFKRAMDYGNIRDYNSAFKFYNSAINKAQQAGDKTYLYIAIQRKLSICLGLSQLDSQTDCDLERIDCVRILNEMMTEGITNSEDLGYSLIEEEMAKKKNAPRKDRAHYQKRVDRLKEAAPMLSAQLAMGRGDRVTASKYISRIREAEQHIYSYDPVLSHADLLEMMYDMIFNSPEREEYEKDENLRSRLAVDDDQKPEFQEDMLLCDRFNTSLFFARNFMIAKMFNSAENFCKYLVSLANEAKSDYHMALALNSYGQMFESKGEKEHAIETYQKALSTLENADMKVSDADLSPFMYYNLLCEIGNLQKNTYPEASICCFSKAIEWLENHDMPQMLFMFQILNGRADAYQNTGKNELAYKDRTDFLRFAENETRRRILLLDSDSRDIFWNDARQLICKTIANIRPDSPDYFKTEAYNAVLLSKGILLASEESVKDLASKEPRLKQLYEELEKTELRRKQWGTSETVEEYTKGYLRSMKFVTELEQAMTGHDSFLHTVTEDIAKALGKNDVLVDFFDYETEDDDRQYIAFVLRQESSVPEVVELCKESELSSFFETQMKMGDAGKEVDFQTVYNPFFEESHRLGEMIWKPVEDICKIDTYDRVMFVPSGSLHKVVIESLPSKSSWDDTLSDRYALFARLAHARSLLCPQKRPNNKTAAIFAAPDYGGDKDNVVSSQTKGYSVKMSDYSQKVSEWPLLPKTKKEAEELQALFGISGWTVDSFTENEATAANFMNIDGNSPTVLHISTHGFAETKQSAGRIPALSSFYKPLDLTGIVLADGNEGWLKGTGGSHTGIVLASDIAKMDLSGSDIVFVSCCFSGEGTVKPDGIYGIQRALKKAGAHTVIMSLWAESEDSGKIFAKEFYRSYLYSNDKDAAFRSARNAVHKTTDNPYLWAGFIKLD